MNTSPSTTNSVSNRAVSIDPNEHIRSFLKYYLEFKQAPMYAVLLSGAWGIGKTFLIRRILDSHFQDQDVKYVYVSLYGLSTFEEIDRALLGAMYPVLDSRVAVLAGKAAKIAMNIFKAKNEFDLDDLGIKFQNRLYVFDDLERCSLTVQKAMGYINEFVEHEGCKVIIIANEDAIADQKEYRERREKTVGKILEVQSAVNDALTFFLSKVDGPECRALLHEFAPRIKSIFDQSKLNNLRILQQTLWDFERLFNIISPARLENKVAIGVLIDLIFALSFEVKSGRLAAKDLGSRQSYRLLGFSRKRSDDKNPEPVELSILRYEGVNIADNLLSDSVCIDILCRGVFHSSDVEKCMAESPYFQEFEEQAAWRLVWNLNDVSDEVFSKALVDLEEQFIAREFVIPGEMLHVFGIRLWASSNGLLAITRDEIFSQNLAYIDDVFDCGRLDGLEGETFLSTLGGYGGLSMHEENAPDFRSLVNHLSEKRKQARRNQLPAFGTEILSDMKSNLDVFSKIALQNGVEKSYAYTPILATIDPEDFFSTWATMTPVAQKNLAVALDGRYRHQALGSQLKDEHRWLQKLDVVAQRYLSTAGAATRVRFDRLLDWSVRKYAPKKVIDGSGSEATL